MKSKKSVKLFDGGAIIAFFLFAVYVVNMIDRNITAERLIRSTQSQCQSVVEEVK